MKFSSQLGILFLVLLLSRLGSVTGATLFEELAAPGQGKLPELAETCSGCRTSALHLERSGVAGPGQQEWDARFYEIAGTLDFDAPGFDGTVRAYLTPTEAIDHLILDAFDNLSEIEVRLDGEAAEWSRLDEAGIRVETPAIGNGEGVDEEHVVEIDYWAVPSVQPYEFSWSAFTFPSPSAVGLTCQTMTETQYAGTWWPCIDRLSHKPDSLALSITVPDTMIVASNGLLESLTIPEAGMRTYHWRERYPIATYLVSITVAPFYSPDSDGLPWEINYGLAPGDSLPFQYFVWPAHLEDAQKNLARLPDMMDCFRALYGEYPFTEEKYGIAEYSFLGGMEHQTLSSIGSSAVTGLDSIHFVQSHELAHQWYGDWVSPATWEDIWLNEGFATYGEALYYEHFGRYTAGGYLYQRRHQESFDGTLYDPDYTFGRTSYWKGAWVLHMLRQLTGDEVFFAILDAWAHRTPAEGGVAGGVGDTEDFRRIAEQVSGRDLAGFFERWIYGTGRPHYYYYWTVSPQDSKWRLELQLQQIQSEPLFPDSLDVGIVVAAGDSSALDSILRVEPDQVTQQYVWVFDAEPLDVLLDPDHRLLHRKTKGSAGAGAFTLKTPWPNPFSSREGVTIPLSLRQDGRVRVEVYSVAGRRVATLMDESSAPIEKTLIWDGRDDDDTAQAYGIYFIRAEMSGQVQTRKVVFLPVSGS